MRNLDELEKEIEDYKSHESQFSFYKDISPYVEQYLQAVRQQDDKVIEYIGKFGNNARQRIMGLREFGRAKLFGYSEKDIKLNEYGWVHFMLKEIERIEFPDWNNCVHIGSSPYEVYTFGLTYSISTSSGGGWSPPVFDEPFANIRDCGTAGLKALKNRLAPPITETRFMFRR